MWMALQDMAPLDQPPWVKTLFSGLPGLRVNLIAFYSSLILTVLFWSLAASQHALLRVSNSCLPTDY